MSTQSVTPLGYHDVRKMLSAIYPDGEATAIARMVFEECFHITLADIYMGRDRELPPDSLAALSAIADRLMQHEPVQYVLGEAVFCGRRFHVEPGVLIPRPETEELCRIVTAAADRLSAERQSAGMPERPLRILDIGTGSGCIAVTLAADIPQSTVAAWDISPTALSIARGNACRHGVSIEFKETDILGRQPLPRQPWDIIVSNPPYICSKESAMMARNVTDYEPGTALFVPDDDPLLFYRSIADYARNALARGGMLAFEINPLYAAETAAAMTAAGLSEATVIADQYGRQRFATAHKE